MEEALQTVLLTPQLV